jgi:hypothetical protein
MITIILIELLVIAGGMTVLILGQPVLTALRHKKPVKHWFYMMRAIFKIAPQRASARLSCSLIIGVIVFITLIIVQKHHFPRPIFTFLPPVILGVINALFLIFSIFILSRVEKRKKLEDGWQIVRVTAHRVVYNTTPPSGEYGTFFELLFKA